MANRSFGPRRSDSMESYLRETRAVALVAITALAGGIAWDVVDGTFWERHALVAGLVASLIVVMLSVAVVNEALERRRRERWAVLAQYVMLQLTRNARVIWTSIAELAGLVGSGRRTTEVLEQGSAAVRDTPHLTAAIERLIRDQERRRILQEGLGHFVTTSDEMLGRWAGVMINVDTYAEIIDRHVELASDVSWVESLLDEPDSAEKDPRRWKNRSHPAIQIEGQIDDESLVTRIVAITQLAEDLDRLTIELALRLVPFEWWAERLGTTASVWSAGGSAAERARALAGRS